MDGVGAAYNAGRWNPVGVEAIYTAASRALAALEILVRSQLNPTLSKSASEFRIRLPVRGQRCQADYIN